MKYTIFRNNQLIVIVSPEDTSELVQKKQSEDAIRLNFVLDFLVFLEIGDYIVLPKNGQKYKLNKRPRVTESPKRYAYECIFEGAIHDLNKVKVFFQTPKLAGGFYNDYSFPLTGNVKTFLLFIVENLTRAGFNITAGIYKDTETQTINFFNWNVYESIVFLADAFDFEWYLENGVLNFDKKEVPVQYLFQIGRNLGMRELTRMRIESEKIITCLYGYGSTSNLPPRTAETGVSYDSDNLTMNRLSFPGDGGESKLSKNVDLYGLIEEIKEFDDIHPEFTGVVESLGSDKRTFFDSTIFFNINDFLLPGVFPKITFLTGKLIGLTFNISFTLSNHKMVMDIYTDESGDYPNALIFCEPGDTYKLYDIYFPESYLLEAQERLRNATQDYLDKHCKPLDIYDAKLDETFLRNHNIVLSLSDNVRVVSASFMIDDIYEIKEVIQKITNPFIYSIKFGDVLPKSLLTLLNNQNFKTQNSITNISNNQVTNNEITNITGGNLEWEQ